MVCGVDEAGRGPVIGNLVIAGAMIDEKDLHKIEGMKDSKQLTPIQREAHFDRIKKLVKYVILEVTPAEIDKTLLSASSNLNWLEADKTIEIVSSLKPDLAYIDCPSNNIEKYHDYLKKDLKMKLVVEHKADENYSIAAAASILAKVTRDRSIKELEKKIGTRLGSGYPSDPVTQEFLRNNYKKHADIFRKTWASYKRLVDTKKQSSLANF